MANGVLGLGGGGSAALNQDLIDKLKAAEKKSTVEPIETKIENWDLELEKISEIGTKVTDFLEQVKLFDLYNSTSAFEQMTASTTGSALFDAVDVSELTPGTVTTIFTQLANKDVYQSGSMNTATKDADVDLGTLTIQVGSETAVDFDTTGKTYDELADEINLSTGVTASVEQVGSGPDAFRLVLKSSESGTDNALTITGAASTSLGYDDELNNHTLTAQNMIGEIDGITYNVSSNTVTVQGNLTVTATELNNTSTITIQRDTSSVITQVDSMLTLYNELVDLVDEEALSADSPVSDTSTLRSMMSQIKDYLFADYGASADKNIFQYGIEIDKTGHLAIDTETFADALNNNFDDLKEIFVGTAANEGLGTQLKTFVDGLDGFEGLLYTYSENMTATKLTLDEDLITANEELDSKYALMSSQFASYGAIIAQMEASFSGLKQMIAESTS